MATLTGFDLLQARRDDYGRAVQAVVRALASRQGHVVRTAASLNISESTLYVWLRQDKGLADIQRRLAAGESLRSILHVATETIAAKVNEARCPSRPRDEDLIECQPAIITPPPSGSVVDIRTVKVEIPICNGGITIETRGPRYYETRYGADFVNRACERLIIEEEELLTSKYA